MEMQRRWGWLGQGRWVPRTQEVGEGEGQHQGNSGLAHQYELVL